MMPGAPVILRMVMIGELVITLCFNLHALGKTLLLTLSSLAVGRGASNAVIQSWRRRSVQHPFGVMLAHSVSLVSLSVSAKKC
jgi:hypothetical protein